ncbi:hypothetical protein [Piscinibacter koreensis]|uniref:Uncharacterized protein n=1 Tax=Piscinibacter koreensis TaxID=2742824 RepID=A0A7Y6NMR3_9BURK|nr:hypothetical protein [Schlegelella koreensis]NUZ06058.1 hypothetical protein [Schlegelella koreensis]
MRQHSSKLHAVHVALVSMLASALVAACGGSDDDDDAPANPGPSAPATPAAPAQSAQIAARTHYFGAENVDQATGAVRSELVVMSWMSNTTYAAAINGKVVLLDAALMRRETTPGRTPTTLDEVVALMPSYIFVGKAAPGYADLAANVAFRTGATVVGTQEHCDALEADARRQQNWSGTAKLLKCTAVVPVNQPIGQTVTATQIADLATCVRAVKHSDQNVATADPRLPAASFDWSQNGDARDATLFPRGTAARDNVTTTGAAGGPALLYHFTIGAERNFTLVWNDRVGSLPENAPVALGLLRSLPKTDVQVGSVDVSNASSNGLRDAAYYIQALQPKIFFPAGHDAAAQRAGAFNTAELMKRALEASIDNVGVPNEPELRINFDPYDYVKPHDMTFDPSAPAWQRAGDRPMPLNCQ